MFMLRCISYVLYHSWGEGWCDPSIVASPRILTDAHCSGFCPHNWGTSLANRKWRAYGGGEEIRGTAVWWMGTHCDVEYAIFDLSVIWCGYGDIAFRRVFPGWSIKSQTPKVFCLWKQYRACLFKHALILYRVSSRSRVKLRSYWSLNDQVTVVQIFPTVKGSFIMFTAWRLGTRDGLTCCTVWLSWIWTTHVTSPYLYSRNVQFEDEKTKDEGTCQIFLSNNSNRTGIRYFGYSPTAMGSNIDSRVCPPTQVRGLGLLAYGLRIQCVHG